MKLSITTWQRTMLSMLIGQLRGDVALMRKAIKCADVLEMSDDEKEAIGWADTPAGPRWQDAEHCFDVQINDKEAANLVKRVVREYDQWPAAQAAQVIDLCAQLGIEDEPVDEPQDD